MQLPSSHSNRAVQPVELSAQPPSPPAAVPPPSFEDLPARSADFATRLRDCAGPSAAVLRAVATAGGRVTVSDVAAATGESVPSVRQQLLSLVTLTRGRLEITRDHNVIFAFPRNFRSRLRFASFRERASDLFGRVWPLLFFIVRISFGVFLIGSIALTALAITPVVLAAMRDSHHRRNTMWLTLWFGRQLVFDGLFLWFSRPRRQWEPPTHGYLPLFPIFSDSQEEDLEAGQISQSPDFLSSVFSFLFGDGNPNHDFQHRRWALVGDLLLRFDGCVCAEQLVPYVADCGPGEQIPSDTLVLPAVQRFDGWPEVVDENTMIYHFPSFQVTASTRPLDTSSLPSFAEELEIQFSSAPKNQLRLVLGLGCLNFVAVAAAQWVAHRFYVFLWVSVFSMVERAMVCYATMFLLVPLCRYLFLKWYNENRIRPRNEFRRGCASVLASPDEELLRKLKLCSEAPGKRVVAADSDAIVYATQSNTAAEEARLFVRAQQVVSL